MLVTFMTGLPAKPTPTCGAHEIATFRPSCRQRLPPWDPLAGGVRPLEFPALPPAAAHRDEQRGGVLVALRLGAGVAEPGLLVEPLGVEQPEEVGLALAVADPLERARAVGDVERTALARDQVRVVPERLEHVGDLPERLQHRLPV